MVREIRPGDKIVLRNTKTGGAKIVTALSAARHGVVFIAEPPGGLQIDDAEDGTCIVEVMG